VDIITITCLLVGHMHIDVDGFFGTLWVCIRKRTIATALAYACAIVAALATAVLPCEVIDLFVIPDYSTYIKVALDPKFGGYARKGRTQHQFKMVKVERSTWFPFGVKTMYRKYSADNVIEIIEDTDTQDLLDSDHVSLKPRNVYSQWEPQAE
jgi:hypothetical protein